MEGNKEILCDLCNARHLTQQADEYCPRCQEALCESCRDHHKVSKATKSHQTITVEDYSKLPPFFLQIKQQCEEHGEIFEFYCPVHDEICCKRCMMLHHNGCKGSSVIDDIIKDSSCATLIENNEKTIHDIESNINIIVEDRKKNLSDVDKQKQDITKRVKETRAEIDRYLDKLEQEVLEKLDDIETENKNKIQEVIDKLEEIKDKTLESKHNISLIKKYASTIQIFMGMRELREPISSKEKYIKSLEKNGSFNSYSVDFDASNLLSHVTDMKFGSVSASCKQSNITLSWQSERAAQIFSACRRANDIDKIQIKRVRKIDVKGNCIHGCAIEKKENTLFATDKSMVLKYDKNGSLMLEFKVKKTHAFDIVPVDERTVIITGGGFGHDIHITDLYTLNRRRIDTGDWSYGATFHSGALISCTDQNGIRRFQISNDVIISSNILVDAHADHTYITSDKNYLYHSSYHTNSITCFDLKGKNIWTYTDRMIVEPRGIAVDSQSNIYVAGSASNNVVVISPDGKRVRQLLGPGDGLENPHAIRYDKESDQLLVTNYTGPAFLYKIS